MVQLGVCPSDHHNSQLLEDLVGKGIPPLLLLETPDDLGGEAKSCK